MTIVLKGGGGEGIGVKFSSFHYTAAHRSAFVTQLPSSRCDTFI